MEADALKGLAKAAEGQESLWITALVAVAGAVLALHRFGFFKFLKPETTVQAESFQSQLMAALEKSHAREDALAAKLEHADKRNDELREELQESRFETRMMRQQLRLFLAWLQQVRSGAIGIEVPIPEIELKADRP